MPSVNGNNYRSFGQGYAAEKAKMKGKDDGGSTTERPSKEDGLDGQKITKIKDHGDGKFSVKHADGEVTKHGSADDMMAKLHEKFGASSDEMNEDEDEDMDGADAMQSLLG